MNNMENDVTRVVDSQVNGEQQSSSGSPKPSAARKGLETAGAAAAGAVLGAGLEAGAEQLMTPETVEAPVDEPSVADDVESQTAAAQDVQPTSPTPAPEPAPEPNPAPAPEPEPVPEPAPEPETDPDVRVLGVGLKDNGQGGTATIIGVQSGDDVAVVVDVESDGEVDVLMHDDNGDGQIEANEVHDVSGQGISTGRLVHEYVNEAQEQGTVPTATNLDTGQQYEIAQTPAGFELESMDDDLMAQQCDMPQDDMPDYVNDADTGIMDA